MTRRKSFTTYGQLTWPSWSTLVVTVLLAYLGGSGFVPRADTAKVEVTDPLAAPWTVRRNATATATRAEPETEVDLAAELEADLDRGEGPDTGPSAAIKVGPASELDFGIGPFASYLDAEPPALRRSRAGILPGSRRAAVSRRLSLRLAVPLLALLLLAALVLTGAIVRLASMGVSAAGSPTAATSPLAVPAPAMAGGLPRHYQPATNPVTQALITDFTHRFARVAGAGWGRPAALYREPGTIDIATDQPGWVMYLGFNSARNLGRPVVTADRAISALIGSTAPDSFWVAAPGPRGGSARCAITAFGTTSVSLCAWATEHTIGALLSPTADTRGNELAVLMPLMRLDLQPG